MVDVDTLRRSFNDAARAYDAERPGYPEPLFDDLVATARLSPGAHVLEIACGTGKATRSLLARGLRVTAVELGENLAAVARAAFVGAPFAVHVGRIEDWDPPPGAFPLAVCAQAWHWVEPELAGPVVARALAPGGLLACLWNHELERVSWLDEVYAAHAPVMDRGGAFPSIDDRVTQQRAHLTRGGALEVVGERRYPWTMRKRADEYVRLIDTYSDHATLPAATRAQLYPAVRAAIEARGGVIERAVVACVLLARPAR